jgi:flavin-dependent dehydrogenase
MNAANPIVGNLVIGGGPAGSMLAMRLAAAGREVTLLERERSAHHKVCGEFLSREAVGYLRQAGVDPLALGAATIRFVRLSVKQRTAEAALPFTALSLSRCVLDEALLARAAELGCSVQRGAFVENLTNNGGVWHAQLRDSESQSEAQSQSWSAPTVFLASGKHDLRGLERGPGAQSDLIGFKLHWRLALSQTEALRECMELLLFPGGYGGLSLIESNVANFCLVVRRSVLRKIGGWSKLLAKLQNENLLLAKRLHGATALWERPLAVSPIPYGYLAGRPSGLWCVGDQAAVIPSFTGDGMSIALHSASLAAQMYLAGETTDQYYRTLQSHLGRGMGLATGLSRAVVMDVGRTLASCGLSLFPNALRWIANSTRIPEHALLQAAMLRPARRSP